MTIIVNCIHPIIIIIDIIMCTLCERKDVMEIICDWLLSSSVIPTLRTICSHSSHDTDDHRAQDTGHVSCHIPVCRNHVCLLISPSFIISHLERFQFLNNHHKRHNNMFLTTGIVLTILSTSALAAKDNAVSP